MIKTPGYRLLVKPDDIETKTSTGIVLAVDERLEKGARVTGTVIDIGPECWGAHKGNQPWCKVGDKIFWAKYAGKNIVDPTDDKDYVILNDEDVVGVVYPNESRTDLLEALSA